MVVATQPKSNREEAAIDVASTRLTRIEEQRWFMDKWNERVAKWRVWAEGRSTSVEFEYWGEHEIFSRLSTEEHAGRTYFWFNKEQLSQQWFENRLTEVIANSGPRYTPALHVELPIAEAFEALGRTPAFLAAIRTRLGKIQRAFARATPPKADHDAIRHAYESIAGPTERLLEVLTSVNDNATNTIALDQIQQLSKEAINAVQGCVSLLREG